MVNIWWLKNRREVLLLGVSFSVFVICFCIGVFMSIYLDIAYFFVFPATIGMILFFMIMIVSEEDYMDYLERMDRIKQLEHSMFE